MVRDFPPTHLLKPTVRTKYHVCSQNFTRSVTQDRKLCVEKSSVNRYPNPLLGRSRLRQLLLIEKFKSWNRRNRPEIVYSGICHVATTNCNPVRCADQWRFWFLGFLGRCGQRPSRGN